MFEILSKDSMWSQAIVSLLLAWVCAFLGVILGAIVATVRQLVLGVAITYVGMFMGFVFVINTIVWVIRALP